MIVRRKHFNLHCRRWPVLRGVTVITQRKTIVLLAVLWVTPSSIFAEVSDESIDKLMDLSGFTEQVKQFPGLIKEGMTQARAQGAPIPDVEFHVMLEGVDESILPSEILQGFRSSLKETVTEDAEQRFPSSSVPNGFWPRHLFWDPI